jgi:hypothetical protein
MRRPSYLARIVEDVSAKKRQPVLAPPRLLFRPGPIQLEFGVEAALEPAGHRPSNSPRKLSADRGRSEADVPVPTDKSRRHSGPLWPETRDLPTTQTTRLPPRDHHGDAQSESSVLRTTAAGRQKAYSDTPANTSGEQRETLPKTQTNSPQQRHSEPAKAPATACKPPGPAKPLESSSLRPSNARAPQAAPSSDAKARDGDPPHRARKLREHQENLVSVQKAEPPARSLLLPSEPRPSAPRRIERETPGPRVHIGTLEVRIIPPAPTPRESTAVATPTRRAVTPAPPGRPLARGFGVFGFQQS